VPFAPTTAAADRQAVRLYFIRDDTLVEIDRELASRSIADVIAALVEGPLPGEDEDLRSALPEGAVLAAEVRAGVATIELDRPFKDVATNEQRLAVAQLVVTMTARPGVGQVAFTIDDEPVPVPTGDGELADRPVSRDDYAGLVVAR
jgi:spore germination protein GerM